MPPSLQIPRTTKALVVQKASQQGSTLYHDAVLQDRPIPALTSGQVLVKMGAVAFNHRDVRFVHNQQRRLRALYNCKVVDTKRPIPWNCLWERIWCRRRRSARAQYKRSFSPHPCVPSGTVVASADHNDPLIQKRVFLVPMRGWDKDPDAPEST